ncbi:MAG: helix-turn-helix transcriptional regulator [Actinobacteria bacterium]|nr:MAG: helix-turn-helix transcriptional regulator [Actinomycetota bacterium]
MTVKELALTQRPAECCAPLAAAGMSGEDAATTAEVFKALADPVCDLTPQLGLSQPTVSFHLKKLATAGLLRREQRGVWAYYSVDRSALDRLATVFRLEEVRA